MYTVTKQAFFKPTDTSKIIQTMLTIQQPSPNFVQMSRTYDGDFMYLTDDKAIDKVLDTFYKESYQDKEISSEMTKLELAIANNKQSIVDTEKTVTKSLDDTNAITLATVKAVNELANLVMTQVEVPVKEEQPVDEEETTETKGDTQ